MTGVQPTTGVKAGAALLVAALGVAGAAWLALTLSGVPPVGYDDANIFFVYARNLVEGHGFVYNPGGERVEGFTSLSWALICAAARALTSRHEIVLLAINVGVQAIALSRLHALVSDLLTRFAVADRRPIALLSIGLTAAVGLSPGYVIWNVVSLMDSGLWSALVLLLAIATVRLAIGEASTRSGRLLQASMVALVVTRPEALLWGPVFVALWMLIDLASGSGLRVAIRHHAGAAIAFAVTTAALVAWRLAYFGYPFPNTYYAKAGDPLGPRLSAGAAYLLDFVVANPAFLVAVPAAIATVVIASVRYRRTRDDRTFRLLLAQSCVLVLLLVGAAVPAIGGGDHFGYWRMYQPVVPLAVMQAVLTGAMMATIRPSSPAFARSVCAAAILLAVFPWRLWTTMGELTYASPAAPDGHWNTARVEIAIAEDMREIGRAFNRVFPEIRPRVGVIVAGGFALEYRGTTVDLMGLNSVAMAHAPGPRAGMRNHAAFNHDVFFALAPDVLLLSLWSPARPDWFDFPMLSGSFEAPPSATPGYFQRRAVSMDIFDAGVLKGLLHEPRMGPLYQWAAVRQAGSHEWIHAVFSRAFLQRLGARGYEIALPGPAR